MRVVAVTKGQFSLLDCIEILIKQTGPADLVIATWAIGLEEIERLGSMLKSGRARSLRLLLDRSFPTRHPTYASRLTSICKLTDVRLTHNHAKFALIAGGDYRIAIRTSMNLNTNPRLEQLDLDDDPAIYAFFAGIMDAAYETIPAGLSVPRQRIESGFQRLLHKPAQRAMEAW